MSTKTNLVRGGLFMAALGLFFGFVGAGEDKITWGAPLSGCRLGTLETQISVNAGEPIDLKVFLSNDGNDAVHYGTDSAEPFASFKISATGSDDKAASETSYAKQSGGRGLSHISELKPNERVSQVVRISRLLDLSIAGEYTLKIEYALPSSVGGLVRLQTKPIRLVIKEADIQGMGDNEGEQKR